MLSPIAEIKTLQHQSGGIGSEIKIQYSVGSHGIFYLWTSLGISKNEIEYSYICGGKKIKDKCNICYSGLDEIKK